MTHVAIPRPVGWQVLESRADGEALRGRGPTRKLRVIWSDHREDDGCLWRHVSVSAREAPLPTWDELQWVRREFIGGSVAAYQVHPPEYQHVNIHSGVLHLWANLDKPDGVLPDFTGGMGTI